MALPAAARACLGTLRRDAFCLPVIQHGDPPCGSSPAGERFCIDPAEIEFARPRVVASPIMIFFVFLPVILFFGTFKYAEGNADWAA